MVEFFLFLDTKWLGEIPEQIPQNVSTSVLHFGKPSVSNNSPVKPKDHRDDESGYAE